ncbi:MAG: ferrochelatase [Cocleimonas sp.]
MLFCEYLPDRDNQVPKIKGDKTFFHGKSESIGVLLINLGTPEEPTTKSVRKYLRQFLSDSRVVEIPRLVWLPILYGLVLPKRPAKSAENYKKIWSDEQGSPLLHYSQRQKKLLQNEVKSRFKGPVYVELAMRYGKPDIESGLKKLQEKGAHRLLVLPLYPQYSATTTATSFDEVSKVLRGWRWIPEFRFISQYHDHPSYIKTLANSVKDHWKNNTKSDILLMSFHGLPKRNLDLGDPYYCHCQKTGRLLADKLELTDDQWKLTFQSRFGKAEWLKPYTDETLKAFPAEGVKSVDVICPGFPSDCLETLEEIEDENREYFMEAGGEQYNYIAALNDHPSHIQTLADIIQQHSQGWLEAKPNWNATEAESQSKLTQARAKDKGAKV